jgi:hypothetical protein
MEVANMKRIVLSAIVVLGLIALPALAQDATTQATDHHDTNSITRRAIK